MQKEQSGAPRMCRQCRGNVYLLRETVSIRAMPMDLLAQERIFGGERTVDGKNIQFHVKTRVRLDYTGTVDGDTMKGTMSSWYVRGRFPGEKELGSSAVSPATTG